MMHYKTQDVLIYSTHGKVALFPSQVKLAHAEIHVHVSIGTYRLQLLSISNIFKIFMEEIVLQIDITIYDEIKVTIKVREYRRQQLQKQVMGFLC